jgi:uncharacterized protein
MSAQLPNGDTTMTSVFRADDLNSSDYTESLLAPPMATPLSGDIVVRDRSYLADEKSGVYSGSWESEPGTSRWEFTTTGEVITVVSGSMTVEEDGGEACQINRWRHCLLPNRLEGRVDCPREAPQDLRRLFGIG